MFNMDDINEVLNKDSSRVPSGIADDSEFLLILQSVTNTLASSTYDTTAEREALSMKLINIACDLDGNISEDRCVSVILSLISHCISLLTSFEPIDIDIKNYFTYFQNEIIGPMLDTPGSPYYDW